jgi:hypothetical protein
MATPSKRPVNYTTTIPVTRTVSECQALLGEGGAAHVGTMYADRMPVGLSFQLRTPHGVRTFVMPVNIDGVASLLRNADYPASVKTKDLSRYVTREHAARVAWRVIRDWIEAQLALIAAEMASIEQIMLPYLQIEGTSVWDRYLENEQRSIGGS